MRFLPTTLLFAALFALPAPAQADRPPNDGLYGRWDEDLVISLGAGAAAPFEDGDAARGAVAGSASFRFYGAAGPLVAGAWGPSAPYHVFVGAELRPLFPGLFLLDLWTGNAFVDLLVQSLAIELGAAFLVDGEGSAGLGVGLAFEVPLVRPDVFAQGLWLRLGARRIAASSRLESVQGEGSSQYVLQATLVLSLGAETGMENAEPPRYR